MNFPEFRRELRNININALNITSTAIPDNMGGYNYSYSGLIEMARAVDALDTFDAFKDLTELVKKTQIYIQSSANSLIVSSEEDTAITRAIRRIFNDVMSVKRFLEFSLPEEKENSIRIKLPPADDFDEISRILNDLKRAISIPVVEVGGKVIVEQGESGSIWLLIYLGTERALKLVAELSWAAMVLMRKKKDNDFVNLQLKDYALDLEYKQILLNAQKQLTDQLVEAEAINIQSQFELGTDPERGQRIILSIKTIAELYERGAEIRPAINTSENITQLFPSKSQMPLIESRTKKLASGDDAS